MELPVYDEMARQDESSWYYRGKRAAIASLLSRTKKTFCHIVDLGCGTGRNAVVLLPFIGKDARYVGVEPHDLTFDPPTGIRSAHVPLRMEDVTEEDVGGRADLIMMIDVLEHVDETMGLETARRLLGARGHLLITVPAYPILWGKSDLDAHHRCRYTAKTLRDALARHDFEIVTWNHYFAFGFIPLALLSFWQRRHFASKRTDQNGYFGPSRLAWLLGPTAHLEGFLGRWIFWPFGTGIVCLAIQKELTGKTL